MLGVTVQVYVTLRARTRIRACARTYIRNYDRRRVLCALSFYGDERQQRTVAKRFLSYARTIVGTVRNVNLLLTATVRAVVAYWIMYMCACIGVGLVMVSQLVGFI